MILVDFTFSVQIVAKKIKSSLNIAKLNRFSVNKIKSSQKKIIYSVLALIAQIQ